MATALSDFAKSRAWWPAGLSKWAMRFLVGIAIGLVSVVVFYAGLLAAVLYSLRVIEF
ncbi:MAG TPA: hypothetical protein VEJ16_19060 [Alphaproteobacteria bacterium]|nr:hypothetical protein [Alphaproteobacteria bacterium]